MSRRPIRPSLRLLGGATAAAVAAATLAACGSADKAGGGDGGTLRIAAGTDAGETLNPYASFQTPTQELRSNQLYEGLTQFGPTGKLEWGLATAMTPNADFTKWTIKLRPDVKFTDGSDLTSADVVASIKYLRDPKHTTAGLGYIEPIDPNAVKAVDKLTVEVGLTKPFGPFKDIWANDFLPMTKAGSAPRKPVGTGPFVVTSFTPGRQTKLARFDDYWGEKAKLAAVTITEYQSPQAQANAVLSNQVDVASGATPTIAKSLAGKNGIKVLDSKGDFTLRIGFNTKVKPFSDVRVRQAMRLLVDRKQVVDNAFGGYARVANDTEGGTPQCPPSKLPQRTQDIAQAKELLADAGQSNLSFSIATDGLLPGMREMAQVFAENAAQAGVKVKVNVLPPPEFLKKYGKWPSFIDFNTVPYLPTVMSSLLPGRVLNAVHWESPEFIKLADQLFAGSESEQCATMAELQRIEYEQGGSLIPAFVDQLLPYRSGVSGLVGDVNGRPLRFLKNVTVGS